MRAFKLFNSVDLRTYYVLEWTVARAIEKLAAMTDVPEDTIEVFKEQPEGLSVLSRERIGKMGSGIYVEREN